MLAQITVRTEQLSELLHDLQKLDPLQAQPTSAAQNLAYSKAVGIVRAWIRETKQPYEKPACLMLATDSLGGKA
jgi:hypothetical protein